MRAAEHALERPVVMVLQLAIGAARRQQQGLRILNPIVIKREPRGLFIGIKKGQNQAARTHHIEQTAHHLFNERGAQNLERIPDQRGVYARRREVQGLFDEAVAIRGHSLFVELLCRTEEFLDRSDQVFKTKTVSETGEKAQVGLARAPQVENRKRLLNLERVYEL